MNKELIAQLKQAKLAADEKRRAALKPILNIREIFEKKILPGCEQSPIGKFLAVEVASFTEVIPLLPILANTPIQDLFIVLDQKQKFNDYKSVFLADNLQTLKGLKALNRQNKAAEEAKNNEKVAVVVPSMMNKFEAAFEDALLKKTIKK